VSLTYVNERVWLPSPCSSISLPSRRSSKNTDSGPPHHVGWLRMPYALKKRRIVHLRSRSSTMRRARCSSKYLEAAYDQRRLVGGPSTIGSSSANGGWAMP
jgi:hypothetical protein